MKECKAEKRRKTEEKRKTIKRVAGIISKTTDIQDTTSVVCYLHTFVQLRTCVGQSGGLEKESSDRLK